MDYLDQILVESAKKHMVRFNLIDFKVEYPSLYTTIRKALEHASKKCNQPREISREDL